MWPDQPHRALLVFREQFFLQTEKELTPIRTALGAEKLPLLSAVRKIWRGRIQVSTIISLSKLSCSI